MKLEIERSHVEALLVAHPRLFNLKEQLLCGNRAEIAFRDRSRQQGARQARGQVLQPQSCPVEPCRLPALLDFPRYGSGRVMSSGRLRRSTEQLESGVNAEHLVVGVGAPAGST
ncbi:MAG: hypothetical protein RL385_677 [Pseudomonadota bacterium]|jgi:hypothetical protein